MKEWIVSHPLFIKRYIYDLNYLPGDTQSANKRLDNARTPNFTLVQNRKLGTDAAETSYKTLQIRGLYSIASFFNWSRNFH